MNLTATPQGSLPRSPFEQSVQYIKGVGPKRAELLKRIGIHTIRDLLFYFPREYQDRRNIVPISNLLPGESATVIGAVKAINESRPFRRGSHVRHILKVVVSDNTGILYLIWFNQPFRTSQFQVGDRYIFSGKVSSQTLTTEMNTPEYEKVDNDHDEFIHTQRIVPIYPLSEQINQRWLRSILKQTVEKYAGHFPEILPCSLIARYSWMPRDQAIQEIHFPSSTETLLRAKQRLIYEELFLLQLLLAGQKAKLHRMTKPQKYAGAPELVNRFLAQLPFVLTYSQQKVIQEIRDDLMKPFPMNRLLQGDVGSGKTVVALTAMLIAIGSGYQSALMAPTEILAQQHYTTINSLLKGSGLDS